MLIDESLLPFATDRQAEAIKAYIDHGSYAAAARALAISPESIQMLIKRAKRRAGTQGLVPELGIDKPFPEVPHIASGYSRYFKTDDGGYWIKTKVKDQQYFEMLAEAIDEMKQGIKPVEPIKLDAGWEQPEELLNFYVLSDIHFGARSWGEETGADWDLDIAERVVKASFRHLIERSSEARYGYLCQLGDALHYDGLLPVTATSGNILDADSRAGKMVRMALRVLKWAVMSLLEKHEHVTVLHAMGNHDAMGSVWLQEAFALLFEDNPRCHIVVNPSPYYAHLHGRAFIGTHHGDKANLNHMVEVFTGRRYWPLLASARQAYYHSGHLHHREVKEFNGGIAERHPTLAASSSYESQRGCDADRSMTCITYHAAGMEHSRVLFHPEVACETLPKVSKTAQSGVSAA